MTMEQRAITMPAQWGKKAHTEIPSPPVPGQAYRNEKLDAENIEAGQSYDKVYDSARMNQLDFITTGLAMESEQYGVMRWSPLTNYTKHALCLGMDGILYQALQASGPGTEAGPQRTDTPAYWVNYTIQFAPSAAYELCEFYLFRHPVLRPGFQPAQGGLLENADKLYPEAWEYLQSTDGQLLCKTEAEWQAMTTANWATLANGSTVGWNGIGGAPFYAPNLETGSLRLPDLRGMYAEAAGFDDLGVGGSHGDAIRNIVSAPMTLNSGTVSSNPAGQEFPPFRYVSAPSRSNIVGGSGAWWTLMVMDISMVVPTAVKNQPRAWGALACVYLGAPK